ncbi:MAG: NTP/NDP exchange transporter [Rickettsiaceae bacterium]|nr:MAG: NTP/NDP exchange transporter [Rickettsiaceae bacterium]
MSDSTNNNVFSSLRKIIWPIEWHENKKFLPMAAMMFCILLNYSTLRSIKDGFVVTAIGPEAISFLKTYIVLPVALISMILYIKLCDILSPKGVFYTVTTFFLVYFALFAFVFYPNPDLVHPHPDTIEQLSIQYPNFKWFIRIFGKWSFATFYAMSELWGSMMLSLLFWQFANQITKTDEAKRFYSMFGMLANLALPLAGLVISLSLSGNISIISPELEFLPLFVVIIVSGVAVILLYKWINDNVLTDPTLYEPKENKKKKAKLSLGESFKIILSSKYLGLIALLVLAYGVSTNLIEGVWKSKIQQLYPTAKAYTQFMGDFQSYQGVTAILFMIVGSNILRKVSWKTAAMLTPIMMLVTGGAFFSFIFFDNTIAMYLTGFLTATPLVMAVMLGTVQQVLAKSTKYSLFDATKNMAYIPLDSDLRTKGQAAVEVVGGRFGKSGGGIIQSTFFMLLPSYSFAQATPYFAGVFFMIALVWIFAVRSLSHEYENHIKENIY